MTVVRSGYDIPKNQLYETEAWATEALLRQMPDISGLSILEPAAGNHKIADVLRKRGAKVWTADIMTYARNHDLIQDFLSATGHINDAIITNPPYGAGNRTAVKFVEKALELCPGYVAMLLTAKFDFGKTRLHLTRDNPRFMKKIALVDRIQWFPGDTSGTEDHAWYVWGPVGRWREPAVLAYEGKAA